MPAASSGSSASRSSRRGSSRCCSRPISASSSCRTYARGGHARSKARSTTTPFYRAFRRALEFCVARPLVVIAVAVALLGLGLSQFSKVQQQFFPLSERPELFFEMRLAEGTSIQATEGRPRGRATARRRRRRAVLHDLYRQGLAALLARAPAGPAERIVRPDRHRRAATSRRASGSRRASRRAVAKGALSAARVSARSLQFRPAGRLSRFSSASSDPSPTRCASIAERVRDVMRADDRGSIDPHLDWDEKMPSLTARGRSGARPRARADAAGYRADAADLDRRRHGDDAPRRRGEDRRRRPRRAGRARRARPDRQPDRRRARRRAGAGRAGRARVRTTEEPIIWRNRDIAITARADVVDGVQPPDVSTALWPKLARHPRQLCRRPIASRWAARSRKSQKGNRRSSCCSRS